nr:hypothetical protein [Saccharopolyspora sp. HNM0983]
MIALVVVGWFVREHSGDTATGTLPQVPGVAEHVSSVRAPDDGVRAGEPPAERGDNRHEHFAPGLRSADGGLHRLVTGESSEVYYTSDQDESSVVVDAAS